MIVGVHHLAVSTPGLARFVDHYQRWYGFVQVGAGGATRATYGRDCDGTTVELLQVVDPACGFGYPVTA